MVHRLHALPAGDLAGQAAGPVDVPDDGRRPDWITGRQCLSVGRADRGGGGDVACPANGAQRQREVLGGRRHPPADGCSTRDSGRTRRYRDRDVRSAGTGAVPGCLRGAAVVPGIFGSAVGPGVGDRKAQGGRCGRLRHVRPAGVDPNRGPRFDGGGRRGRFGPTFRGPDGLRWPACRVPRRPGRARALAAGAPGRGEQRRGRPSGLQVGPADARTAHST